MTKPIVHLDVEDEISTLTCDCGPAQLLDGVCQNCGIDYQAVEDDRHEADMKAMRVISRGTP